MRLEDLESYRVTKRILQALCVVIKSGTPCGSSSSMKATKGTLTSIGPCCYVGWSQDDRLRLECKVTYIKLLVLLLILPTL